MFDDGQTMMDFEFFEHRLHDGFLKILRSALLLLWRVESTTASHSKA